ncbi:RNA polymerase sigma factor [Lachnospiraceae bacterium LCP25S3_G4]
MSTDFQLIRKMKYGDAAAFDLFVHKYYKEILTYCNYHCYDKEYAEDLTQETFVRFFKNLSNYRYKGKTKNYLYTIAGNLCKDYFKKIKEIPLDETELCRKIESEEYLIEAVLNKITIEQALEKLSDELEEIIILYFFQELKLTEIADILQISLPLVKYRLKQAKIQLEKLLGKEEKYESRRAIYDL